MYFRRKPETGKWKSISARNDRNPETGNALKRISAETEIQKPETGSAFSPEAGNRKCISAANWKPETRNAFLPETRNGKLEMHFRRKLEIKNQ